MDRKNCDYKLIIDGLGRDRALNILKEMLTIRLFEQSGEQSYQAGKVWGFYHSYVGQEAIQTGAVHALGKDKHLWVTTYRCHALALLLGMTIEEGMCELYGKANGNSLGRGGSMHFYGERMYGGNGIVGGQWPIGVGLAFSLKYKNIKDEVAICFGGDGSVAQGSFHESVNLAKLWNLPLIIVIENNQLCMGTQIERCICNLPIGENFSKAYGIKSYCVDGMDFCSCYKTFQEAADYVKKKSTPAIIEAVTHRFRGHSISDAANYRSKEELNKIKERDPIDNFVSAISSVSFLKDGELADIKNSIKKRVVEAMNFADKSDFPNPNTLEDGVYSI